MRVLMATQPGLGHLHPMAPLAAAFAAAGHRVAFACAESFHPKIASLGFETFAAGPDWLESEAEHHFPALTRSWLEAEHHLRIVRDIFAGPAALGTANDLLEILRRFAADLVVRNDFEFASAAVAELAGLPCATVGIELLMPQSFWRSLVGPQLAHLRSCLGLPAQPALPMLFRGVHLALLPPSYQLLDPRSLPGVRFLRPEPPPAPPSALPERLTSRPRRSTVYVTLGTVFNRTRDVFETVLRGLAGEDLDVVATVGPGRDPAPLEGLADNALVFDYLPLDPLLSLCDLVITHGGVNTLLAAFRHGLPVLVVPLSAHHPFHALRVEALGVGSALQGPVPLPGAAVGDRLPLTPDGVRTAVRRLLDQPAFRQASRRLGEEIESLPGPREAVAELEALVGR